MGPRAGLLGATLLLAPSLAAQTRFQDSFSSRSLRGESWVVTADGDFRERTVDVTGDHRLRLRADTVGTRDDTVKFLGVGTREGFALGEGLCAAVTLDWNDQANGSYLSAAVILAGARTANPLREEDWLAVEYVGVPPGRNARLLLRSSRSGRRRTLEDDGWPDAQRAGRKIGQVRVVLFVAPTSIRLWENGELRHQSAGPSLSAKRVFLHLQLSSHSNYPAREVYFDDVEVGSAGAEECARAALPPPR